LLLHSAQASGTDIDLHLLPIDEQCFLVGIDPPLPIGSALGVAYIVTELWRLTAYIAFPRHTLVPFDLIAILL
jgi:hypothetical protein